MSVPLPSYPARLAAVARPLVLTLTAVLLALIVPAGSVSAAPSFAQYTGIRTGVHPGFERVVWDFDGPLPQHVSVRRVAQVTSDGSGDPQFVGGRQFLEITMHGARGYDENTLRLTGPTRIGTASKNLVDISTSGDFEATLSFRVGAWKIDRYRVMRLSNPSRVVLDVYASSFRTVPRKVYFLDAARYAHNTPPYTEARYRHVLPTTPAHGVLSRLFAGPSAAEQAKGLKVERSGATGFSHLSIRDGVARLRLTGGCSSASSPVFTVADLIKATLQQFPNVQYVKIYDPAGRTARPTGRSDSIPECLEP